VAAMSIYENEKYLGENKTWHVEDSPWKATQIMKLINDHYAEININGINSVCEVGCGAGEILFQLSTQLPSHLKFYGYDISPQLHSFWKRRESERIEFICDNFLSSRKIYDILLLIDIVEHIEDYFSFLREIKKMGTYKIFNFPLEIFAVKALLGCRYVDSRKKYGHLHFFNKDICLSLLQELDFCIIDNFYAPSAIELASTSKSISNISKIAKIPRVIMSKISIDLTAKLLGGYSLFVLAK
jgi:hypothetical protein